MAGRLTEFHGLASATPSLAPTFLQLDILGTLQPEMVAVIFVVFFLALFDSVGTLVGVADQAGLMRNGTVVGAELGTFTVTAYIESATGVAAGGRTGLANVVTAGLFFLALFTSPLVAMIGGGYDAGDGLTLYPVVAPALVMVGARMVGGVRRIMWDEPTEAIPVFLTVVIIPLTVSITEGIAFGFIGVRDAQAGNGTGPRDPLDRLPVRRAVHDPLCGPGLEGALPAGPVSPAHGMWKN